jgi:hypothetical protein
MNERGRSMVSPLESAAGTTAMRARALSAALVKDAIAHVNRHLADQEWVRDNRRVHQGIAVWDMPGNNLLTGPERTALGDAYKDEGWHDVAVMFQTPTDATNWKITFQLE